MPPQRPPSTTSSISSVSTVPSIASSIPIVVDGEFPADSNDIITLKIIMIGNSGVGKSALLAKYLRGDTNTKSTIGADHYQKDVTIKGKKVRLQFWDTAGQERYHAIVKSYFNGVHAVMLVFDVTDVKSLHGLSSWIHMVESHAPETAQCVMVGNKSDLIDLRSVSTSVALTVAESRDMVYVETSANLGSNVHEAFNNAAQMAYYAYTRSPPTKKETFGLEDEAKKKSSCCGK